MKIESVHNLLFVRLFVEFSQTQKREDFFRSFSIFKLVVLFEFVVGVVETCF